MQHILLIDTSNNKLVKVGLRNDGKEDLVEKAPDHRKEQVVLPLVEQLMHKHGLRLEEIDAIEVNQGPGSFTGLRVGIAIANTLGVLLQIPVNGKQRGELVEPLYK